MSPNHEISLQALAPLASQIANSTLERRIWHNRFGKDLPAISQARTFGIGLEEELDVFAEMSPGLRSRWVVA
jgi:hypothetical protein